MHRQTQPTQHRELPKSPKAADPPPEFFNKIGRTAPQGQLKRQLPRLTN